MAKKQKSLFPSGLSRNWQAKNHGKNGTGKISANSLKRDTELSPPSPPFEYGGLADEDASAEAPPALPPAKVFGKERNLERSNEVRIYSSIFVLFELTHDNISLLVSRVMRKRALSSYTPLNCQK